MTPIKKHIVFILIIIAATSIVYSGALKSGFIWDDRAFILENPSIRTISPASIIAFFTDRATVSSRELLSKDVWRPLVTLSFAIDHRLWGLDPRFYHIENIKLHIVSAILVYLVVLSLVGNGIAALAAALIFAVHPVQVEAVTYISGRSNVLFLPFFLAAVIFHIQNRRTEASRGIYYNLCLASFFLSLMSKEMAIALPFVLITYDIYFYRRPGIRPYARYYIPFILVAVFYILARLSVLGVVAQRHTWWGGGLITHLFTVVSSLFTYLRLLISPVNLRLEYMFSAPSMMRTQILLITAGLEAILLIIQLFRKDRIASFWFLWFFVTLIPVSNIVPFKAVLAERFLYLPSIGFAALAGLIVSRFFERFRSQRLLVGIFAGAFAAIIVFYGMMTIARNMEWHDEISLYSVEVHRSPENPRFHYNLGFAYVEEAKRTSQKDLAKDYYARAIQEFKRALDINPCFQQAYINLGSVYSDLKLHDLAAHYFRKALAIAEDPIAYTNLGVVYHHKMHYEKALRFYRRAIILKPDYAQAYVQMGNSYFLKGDYARAKKAWIRGAQLGATDPALPEAIKDLTKQGY